MIDHLLPSFGAFQVWRRNALVWRKTSLSSIAAILGEPLLFLLGMGYGLGAFLGQMEGVSYLTFVASGILASSSMNAATFEALYGAFTRMTRQNTYSAMLSTPLSVSDVVAGEILWAASKALFSGVAILGVGIVLAAFPLTILWAIPVLMLSGAVFAGMGMVITALAPSYEFFLYYTTLVTTPMLLFCGIYYSISALPTLLQGAVNLLPLTHVVALIRPLAKQELPTELVLHCGVLTLFAVVAYLLAVHLIRKRLLV